MNNFNLNLFKYFFYVVYYNGFTNASKSLNIAQSSLSYSIKQLELQLGKTLIIRNNKNFELTEDGNNLYETLKSAFSMLNQNIDKFDTNNKIEINIGVRHYLSDFIFRDSIIDFMGLYPDIHLNIKLYSKLDVKKYDEEYDVLIDFEEYTNMINSNNKTYLCSLENIFVTGRELEKSFELAESLKDLDDSKLISMNPNKKNGKFQKMCFENGILFRNVLSINDCAFSKELIKNNMGLCFVNKEFVKEELVSGDIKEIKVKEDLFKDNVYIVYKEGKNVSKIKLLVDLLLSEYEGENNE